MSGSASVCSVSFNHCRVKDSAHRFETLDGDAAFRLKRSLEGIGQLTLLPLSSSRGDPLVLQVKKIGHMPASATIG